MPKSPEGGAVRRTLKNWNSLNRYCQYGRRTTDNNATELAILWRAEGRSNWNFLDSDECGRLQRCCGTSCHVAVILSPPSADAAERLLALVRYQGTITLDERIPTRRDNIGNLVINAFILIGILLAFSAVGGLAVGGVRAVLHRGSRAGSGEEMITLHLGDR